MCEQHHVAESLRDSLPVSERPAYVVKLAWYLQRQRGRFGYIRDSGQFDHIAGR